MAPSMADVGRRRKRFPELAAERFESSNGWVRFPLVQVQCQIKVVRFHLLGLKNNRRYLKMEEMEKLSAYQKAVRIYIYSKKIGGLLEKQSRGEDTDGEIQKQIKEIEDRVEKLLGFFLEPGEEKIKNEE